MNEAQREKVRRALADYQETRIVDITDLDVRYLVGSLERRGLRLVESEAVLTP